ncbi:MAG: hypothetical protein KVP17_004051 [Porospora cf. gigantea B]|uniref:uncharacterized protein n=1 Tax=Porospora cf. gigantea B TaxID=2853592 RepID=UPI003571DE15|nr:MAG: hypothetical protein KVP17_004051 [Porospora cf. gigantea B]
MFRRALKFATAHAPSDGEDSSAENDIQDSETQYSGLSDLESSDTESVDAFVSEAQRVSCLTNFYGILWRFFHFFLQITRQAKAVQSEEADSDTDSENSEEVHSFREGERCTLCQCAAINWESHVQSARHTRKEMKWNCKQTALIGVRDAFNKFIRGEDLTTEEQRAVDDSINYVATTTARLCAEKGLDSEEEEAEEQTAEVEASEVEASEEEPSLSALVAAEEKRRAKVRRRNTARALKRKRKAEHVHKRRKNA